ncbi:hypothetical protein SPOG_03626 [Schizosaccharomyces cryophilus OY26]|uniref:Mug135-like C-terminal domain-containing protein n=1 Tax=Schizosaccharomyces cryophilus (strain OY26 / ATCC MYA-4695 / CBS 11777 / NBRC 106824 / NRRL Y48691) TaxID=653667 RepID=S9W3F1_SCHCR|nr:uncharacterized protein SPOG_03626 [Schizosaccharomyces cryophilus OY26]EPY53079.1 hypothetical protein SPOG_03626 [Schizosaccharomyces cryophilus OY26]
MNEGLPAHQENLSTNDELLYANEFAIPPPRQENVTELTRYLNAFKNAYNDKKYECERHELEYNLERIALRNRDMDLANNQFQSNIQESNNIQPPSWFVNFFNDPNVGFVAIKRELISLEERMNQRLEAMEARQNQRFEALEERMNQRFEAMEARQNQRFEALDGRLYGIEQKLNRQEYRYCRLHNIQLRFLGKSVEVVPFLNAEEPDSDLPRIHSVEDIENLTKNQCTNYLDGYGIRYGPNETIKLKERLRDAVGLQSLGDAEFRFSEFS